jgi:hypothetical protein
LDLPAQAVARFPNRRRATRVAAAAPNRRIIGGAGTGVPPVEPDELPPEEELDDEEELEEDELDEEEVLPDEPKLLDPPVAPELVELDDELLDEEELLAEEAELPLPPDDEPP